MKMAREQACDTLNSKSLIHVARNSGGMYVDTNNGSEEIRINYLGKPVSYVLSEKTFVCDPDEWEEMGKLVTLQEEIFVLHYLVQATGKSPTGTYIPFRQMDGGMLYDGVFRARSVNRIILAFNDREELLEKIGASLGGVPDTLGDVSIKLNVLPNIDIAVVLWKGDDEIPPSGNILFDDAVTDYLPTEDCAVLAESVTTRIMHFLRQHTS